MSLIKHKKSVKNSFKNIENINNASISVDASNKIGTVSLYINSIFKMVEITYQGEVDILKTKYKGINIVQGRELIYISNHSMTQLSDNLLLEFKGNISIKKAKIYPFGYNSIFATIEDYTENKFKKNYEVIGTTSIKFDDIQHSLANIKHTDSTEKLEYNKDDNIIEHLYTSNKRFKRGSKIYKGYYHYHKDTKKFMTGKTHSVQSRELKPANIKQSIGHIYKQIKVGGLGNPDPRKPRL